MISKDSAPHYTWGDDCDGWHLVQAEGLSVIQERMPPGTDEVRHYHKVRRQFFYILSGVATFERNGEVLHLQPGQGVEVPPHVPHQMMNKGTTDLEFLLVSQPNDRTDRVAVD